MTRVSLSFAADGQSVRLPEQAQFGSHVKTVSVRVVGNERIISPAAQTWDSFFNAAGVSEDFMAERETAVQPEREQ
ncbi:type II toxin-antitoxin system VapB family antitoxin [Neisseria sp. 23W00296]|uniref:type II toxin-antitoxin system VapB family antitoxin n=1 Tax=unclassified Neisseria TaxID=2623750 RepID=UPI00375822B2